MALTGKQSRHLRGLGHALNPVVHIGKHGLTDTLREAVDAALLTHELIKVKVDADAPTDREESAEDLSKALRAEVAQVIGHTILLYRPHPEKPVIKLPKE